MRLIVLSLLTLSLFGADTIVFTGIPDTRVVTTYEREEREKLDAEAGEKAECVIVQRGRKYYWASRDDAPLTRVDVPNFTYFIHTGGGGFIKVLTGSRAETQLPADYMEQINRGLETITYWGKVSKAR
jgi:hypothetical protein